MRYEFNLKKYYNHHGIAVHVTPEPASGFFIRLKYSGGNVKVFVNIVSLLNKIAVREKITFLANKNKTLYFLVDV
jgi:hypothetical protein